MVDGDVFPGTGAEGELDPGAEIEEEPLPSASGRLRPLAWITLLGIAWGQSSLLIGTLLSPGPETVGQAISIELTGLLTVAYVLAARAWMPHLGGHPRRNALALGMLNAAIVEVLLIAGRALSGGEGVGFYPDLAIDLVLVLPWYAGVLWLFLRAHDRWRFSVPAVLLLGGLYEAGADWLLRGVLLGGIPIGPAIVLLVVFQFWQFVVVYSSIVLPPALLVGAAPLPERSAGSPWADAVVPLAWLLPYSFYVVAVLSLLAGPGGG